MKNKLFLIFSMAGSLSLSLGASGLTKTREVNAEDNTTSLGLGAAMLGYINNGGNAVTSNTAFDYTIAVGSLSSGTGSTLGSYPAAHVVRGGNKELGAATADDLNYHTDWALGRMHSQNDSRIQWVITAKASVAVSVTVAKILSYPTNSELKYYVFDGAIPNEAYCSNQLKQKNVLSSTMDDASSLNYSTTLSIGQKFVVEWGYQWSGKRNINIKSSGAEMFTLTIEPSAASSTNYLNKMIEKVSNNGGDDVSETISYPIKSYGIYHGDVSKGTISKFTSVASNNMSSGDGTTNVQNWRVTFAANDNFIIKIVANEKMLLTISRSVLGTEWLDGTTFIKYWHNNELESKVSSSNGLKDTSLFSFSHVLNENDVFYYELGSTGDGRNISMQSGGDINTSLPIFAANGFAFSSEDLHPSHTLTKVDGKPSTCEENGYKDYYKCFICDALFEDENGLSKITDFETWKTTDGQTEKRHNLIHHPAVAATATSDGNIEYWECETCGTFFSDSSGENAITDVIIPANDAVTIAYSSYLSKALTAKKGGGNAVAEYDNVDIAFNHGSPKNYSLVTENNDTCLYTSGSLGLAYYWGWQIRFHGTDDAVIKYTAKKDIKLDIGYIASNKESGITNWVGNSSIRFYAESVNGTLELLKTSKITLNNTGETGDYDISVHLATGESLLIDLSTIDDEVNKTISYIPAVTTSQSKYDSSKKIDFDSIEELNMYKNTKSSGLYWYFSASNGAYNITQSNMLLEHFTYCQDVYVKATIAIQNAKSKSDVDAVVNKCKTDLKNVSDAAKFVFNYLHMRDYDIDWNDSEGTNACLDYYGSAKEAFNSLTKGAAEVFCKDSHFREAYDRLSKWALANENVISSDYSIISSSRILRDEDIINGEAIIIVSTVLSVSVLLGLIVLKRNICRRNKNEK